MLTTQEFSDFVFQIVDLLYGEQIEQARTLLQEKCLNVGLPTSGEAIENVLLTVSNNFKNLETRMRKTYEMEKLEIELNEIEAKKATRILAKLGIHVLSKREKTIIAILEEHRANIAEQRDLLELNKHEHKTTAQLFEDLLKVFLIEIDRKNLDHWIAEQYARQTYNQIW